MDEVFNQSITLLPNDEFKAEIRINENNIQEKEDSLKTLIKVEKNGEAYILKINYKIIKI